MAEHLVEVPASVMEDLYLKPAVDSLHAAASGLRESYGAFAADMNKMIFEQILKIMEMNDIVFAKPRPRSTQWEWEKASPRQLRIAGELARDEFAGPTEDQTHEERRARRRTFDEAMALYVTKLRERGITFAFPPNSGATE